MSQRAMSETGRRSPTRQFHCASHCSTHIGAGATGRYSLHRQVHGMRSVFIWFPHERQQVLREPEDLSSSSDIVCAKCPPPGVAALWIKGLAGKKNADRHDRPFHGLTDRGRPEEDAYARPHRADRTSRSCDTEKSGKNCLCHPVTQTRYHRPSSRISRRISALAHRRSHFSARHHGAMPESRRLSSTFLIDYGWAPRLYARACANARGEVRRRLRKAG